MSNDVNYFEIGSSDAPAARAFYGTLFGWSFGEPSMPAQYSMIEQDKGGLWDTSATGGACWAIFYVQVEDVSAALECAQELGATVAVPLVWGTARWWPCCGTSAITGLTGGRCSTRLAAGSGRGAWVCGVCS